MKLHKWLHHTETMYREQERSLWLFWCLNCLHFSKISFGVNTSKPYGLYSWNFTNGCIISGRCVTKKNDHSGYLNFWINSPYSKIDIRAIRIYAWNLKHGCLISRRCVATKKNHSVYFGFWITVKFRYYDHLKLRLFIYQKLYFESLNYSFLHFLHPVYIWLETTFGTVQKWSLRPLLDSPKGGLNIGILLYLKLPRRTLKLAVTDDFKRYNL